MQRNRASRGYYKMVNLEETDKNEYADYKFFCYRYFSDFPWIPHYFWMNLYKNFFEANYILWANKEILSRYFNQSLIANSVY